MSAAASQEGLRAFVVTIDTEANGWDQVGANSIENIDYVAPLQDLFDRHGVRPTYLVTYDMATRDRAIKVLKPIHDRGGCEIGHHLHVWTCPPFQNATQDGIDRAWVRGIQAELPDELFYAKAETLRTAIASTFGRAPTSHRAGRWAIDLRTLRWLRDTGFLVDTSMTFGVSWARTKGALGLYGIDTSQIPAGPFLQDLGQPFRPGHTHPTGLLEVPVSAARLPQRGLARVAGTIIESGLPGSGVASKMFSRIFPRPFHVVPCRVMPWYRESDLLALVEVALAETGVVNLMLHSSEVMPGGSPYSRTKGMHARVMSHVAAISRWAEESGLERLTLSELAQRILPNGEGSPGPQAGARARSSPAAVTS